MYSSLKLPKKQELQYNSSRHTSPGDEFLVRLILLKPNESRSDDEIDCLARNLKPFFERYEKTLPINIYLDIFRELQYERFLKNEIVFNYGDYGKKIYYIYSGEVFVLVPRINDVGENSAIKLESQNNKQHEILSRFPDFLIRNILKKGQNFGEIALLIKGCRNSTIVCKENCEFLIINSETYQKITKKNAGNIFMEKIAFLNEVSLFKEWRRTNISLIMFYLQDLTFHTNQIIYKENDPPNGIYIIWEGTVELLKTINLKTNNGKIRKIELASSILTKGQVFGDEEIFTDDKREFFAKSTSIPCKLYLLTKEELFSNIKSKKYLDHMKKEAEYKKKYHEKMIEKKFLLLQKIHCNKPSLTERNKSVSCFFNSRNSLLDSMNKLVENNQSQFSENRKNNKNEKNVFKLSLLSNLLKNIPKYKNRVLSPKELQNVKNGIENDLKLKIQSVIRQKFHSLTDRDKKRSASFKESKFLEEKRKKFLTKDIEKSQIIKSFNRTSNQWNNKTFKEDEFIENYNFRGKKIN